MDESAWQESRTASALADRLALLSTGRMTEEASTLSQRFPEAIAISCAEIDDWPELTAEHAALLAEATIKLAERGVSASAADPDRRLEHLVHATDEMRTAHNTLESRLVEWVGMFLPWLDLDGRRSEIAGAVAVEEPHGQRLQPSREVLAHRGHNTLRDTSDQPAVHQ